MLFLEKYIFGHFADYAASNGGDTEIVVTEEEFTKWEANQKFHKQMLFSKRVGKWYDEVFCFDMEKAEVMDKALDISNLEELDLTKIDELIDTIREAADNLHK